MKRRTLILVVEDNEANQLLASSVLEREGYLVELTEEGAKIVDEAVTANTASERELIVGLSSEEIEALTALLKKLVASLEPSGPA